ncbi:MAG: hypothetical protein NTZ90_14610 [Proteobacteria bacterium]|nr:hypothetical protein [Pseudomonadota bacterium]
MANLLTTKISASIAVQVLVLQVVACGSVNKLPSTNGTTVNNRSSSGDQDPNDSSAAPSGDAQVSRASGNSTTPSTSTSTSTSGDGSTQPSTASSNGTNQPATASSNGTNQPATSSGSPSAGNAPGQAPGAGGTNILSLSGVTSHLNADAIAHCLAGWGANNPFGPNKTTADAILDVSVKVGNIGAPINDTTVTAQPTLILIPTVVSVGGTTTYNLLNPNGWYCLIADVQIGGNAKINIKSGAHLSKNGVDVLVGRATPPGGAGGVVNVNVAAHESINVVP